MRYGVSHLTVDPDFRTDVGFVRRSDLRINKADVSYEWWPESWLINWGPRFDYELTHDFDGVRQDEKFQSGLDFSFARNISVGIGADREMERFGDIDFWKWKRSVRLNVNTSRIISVGGNFDWGDGIRFSATPFLGRSTGGRLYINLRPFSRLQSNVNVNLSRLVDPRPMRKSST